MYFCSISSAITSNPAVAQTWAIPEPISPQPNTPTFLISIMEASRHLFSRRAPSRRRAKAGAMATERRARTGAWGGNADHHSSKPAPFVDQEPDPHHVREDGEKADS